eukprot:CAMPEP_0184498364 /NCGR_PEP_ID=MMETSP0113_2-20130426/38747_1 /TAXON_ID=91329 /ORGANISM="Norrisiella sphaerica, Strain BC52" /LENGTH=786 /DNA_ID=CAMNT_0026885833 /DNA_START=106 /DNA_END=2466 /DNA_ORIENTATION=-
MSADDLDEHFNNSMRKRKPKFNIKINTDVDEETASLSDRGIFEISPKTHKSPISLLAARRGSLHFGHEFESKLATIQRDAKASTRSHRKTLSDNVFFRREMVNPNGVIDEIQKETTQSKLNSPIRPPQAREKPVEKDGTELEREWKALLAKKDWRKSRELGELMQAGIPETHRETAWREFLRCEKLKSYYPKGYYQSLVQLSEEVRLDSASERKEIFQIDKDLGRTMPGCSLFKSKEGINMLKRVLYAYALRNPDLVGYCQGMNIVAAGLLTVLPEEDAFWGLCVLIELRLGYYTPTMISLKVDQNVLNRMISYKHSALYRHLAKLGVSIFAFTTSWFLCLFMENPLPYKTALQFWDYLFCYGDEMLFLMALEILLHRSEKLLAIDDADELLSFTLHSFQEELDKTSFTRIVSKCGTLEHEIKILRTFYRKAETVMAGDARLDCSTLANRFGFESAAEVQHLWKIFVSVEPWEVLLTESHREVSWFALAFHRACYPKEPDSFCAHGLLSCFIHRLFDTLDVHNTGNVTFKRFLKTVHTLRYGTREERYRLCFAFYDFDGDGKIGVKDMSMGISLISDMIEGWRSGEERKYRAKIARDIINKGFKYSGEEEILVTKEFSSGPFGLQLRTNTATTYPIVKKILIDSTRKKGIHVGWQLKSINESSFKNFDDQKIYSVMKTVKYPALATFRVVRYPKIDESEEATSKRYLSFKQFSKVMHQHAKTYALFRLHGTILDHWKEDDKVAKEKEKEKERTLSEEAKADSDGRTVKRGFSFQKWFGGNKQKSSP